MTDKFLTVFLSIIFITGVVVLVAAWVLGLIYMMAWFFRLWWGI
jgi:hypothetical protein